MFSVISLIRLCTELLPKGNFCIMSAVGICNTVVITYFNAGKTKSLLTLRGLPDVAISQRILYESWSPSLSCQEVPKISFDIVGWDSFFFSASWKYATTFSFLSELNDRVVRKASSLHLKMFFDENGTLMLMDLLDFWLIRLLYKPRCIAVFLFCFPHELAHEISQNF